MSGDSLTDLATGARGAEATGGAEESGDRTGPSVCYVIHRHGSEQVHFDRATVEGLLASRRFFSLDLDQPDEADFEVLRDVFGRSPWSSSYSPSSNAAAGSSQPSAFCWPPTR